MEISPFRPKTRPAVEMTGRLNVERAAFKHPNHATFSPTPPINDLLSSLNPIIFHQIFPLRVSHIDQPLFLFSAPAFFLLLPGNCFGYFTVLLKPNKLIKVILFCKPRILLPDMLQYSVVPPTGHACIKYCMVPVRYHINMI